MEAKVIDMDCCITTCGLPLNSNYWDESYQRNETGWDMHQVSPPLKNYIDTLSNKELKILIPGCGNAYEAEYLLSNGFTNVTLIDIASTLVERLKEKFKGKPIRVLHIDFFEHKEKYDLILEQTFFCAINPSLRQRYAAKCFNLLNPNGKVAGLLFNVIFEKDGPPYGGNKEDYVKLFEQLFELKQFETCTTSIEPRMGNELFIEMERKDIPEKFVKLFSINGITCSGCVEDITSELMNTEGIKLASINSDFSEMLIVSDCIITTDTLQQSISEKSKYFLSESAI